MNEEDHIVDTINKQISMFVESLEQESIIPYKLTLPVKIEIVYVYMEAIMRGFSICHPKDVKSEKPFIVERINDIRERFKEGFIDLERMWSEILGEARIFNI